MIYKYQDESEELETDLPDTDGTEEDEDEE